MNFAIVFGCSISIEQEIINRLKSATSEAAHPLLLPGLLVELERSRHIDIIDRTISDIESRILDLRPMVAEIVPKIERDEEKLKNRNQYLDTAYLRNQLVSWNEELRELISHTEELMYGVFHQNKTPSFASAWEPKQKPQRFRTPEDRRNYMRRVTSRIKDRVQDIVMEYEDKIRDCTMRVDGMAMATQWVRSAFYDSLQHASALYNLI